MKQLILKNKKMLNNLNFYLLPKVKLTINI